MKIQSCGLAKTSELAGITWLFPKVPGWPLKQAIEPEWERTYNVLWQVSATKAA